MMVLHGDLGNPYTLWTAAQGVFDQGREHRHGQRRDLMATVMSDLLETALRAHGGLERWSQLDIVSARLIQGGVLWLLKGQAGVLDDVVVTARLHEARVSHRPFGAPDRHSAFTPERVAIETGDGALDRSPRDRVHLTEDERA
jgi:hypothetical protein